MQHAFPREAVSPAERPMPSPGDLVADKYRVECALGESEHAVVLAAHDELLDRPVALKVMASLREESKVARFLREARTAARIESDHAVKILEVGTLSNGAPYMVLERLEGADLGKIVDRDGPLGVERVADYALQACEALAHAHAAGIIHRDVKPQNLFLCRRADGTTIVKMVDFGIAKADLSPDEKTLTLAGSLLGSPTYMSPEQINQPTAVDARSDVWSLGVVLYKLLSGRPPFAGATIGELVHNVIESEPAPLATTGVRVPAELDAVVMRCLRRAPADRFQDVLSLARALAPFAPAARAELVNRIAFVSGERPKRAVSGSIAPMALGEPYAPTLASDAYAPLAMESDPYGVPLAREAYASANPSQSSAPFVPVAPSRGVSLQSRAVIGALVSLFGLLFVVVVYVGTRATPPSESPATIAEPAPPPPAPTPPPVEAPEPPEPRIIGASPMPALPTSAPSAAAVTSPPPRQPPPVRGRAAAHPRAPAAPPPPAPAAPPSDSLPKALGGRI